MGEAQADPQEESLAADVCLPAAVLCGRRPQRTGALPVDQPLCVLIAAAALLLSQHPGLMLSSCGKVGSGEVHLWCPSELSLPLVRIAPFRSALQ